MKKILKDLIADGLDKMGIIAADNIQIDYAKDRAHGDFACNIALLLAKPSGRKPKDLANEIITHIPRHPFLQSVTCAGAGFINFVVHPAAFKSLLTEVLHNKSAFGTTRHEHPKTIHIEFVSSNPTGPLHVGHGRGAAFGATLSNLLTVTGSIVHREYYVNDAGRQMDILTASLYLRYLGCCGESCDFPKNAYQGDYVINIAQQIYQENEKKYFHSLQSLLDNPKNIPNDEEHKEAYIDLLIDNIQQKLGEKDYKTFLNFGLTIILDDIREDLKEFGVTYDAWFSEQQMWDRGLVERAIALMRDKNYLYEKDRAVWFRSTDFGDDKDRVVIRENGRYTYFAADIAYHRWKCEHYDKVINVLGADHHGYIPRLKAIIQALEYPVEKFYSPIVQFAVLYRGKERVPMSTRAGSFVTLRELRNEVGNDASRFFYIMRKADQHLDFDLALAKSQSNDNPVYYIQYAHARICSIFRQLHEKKLHFEPEAGLQVAALNQLESFVEKNILLMLMRYKETLVLAADQYEPHLLAYYLRELCEYFHSYYNTFQFLVEDDTLRHVRLCLCNAVKQVIANGLAILGVSAPESM
jgi:arginyl-tRNA synthetase